MPPLPPIRMPTFEDIILTDTLLGSPGQTFAQNIIKDLSDQNFDKVKEHATEGLKKVGLEGLVGENGIELPAFLT